MKKTICVFVLLAFCITFITAEEPRGYNEKKSTSYAVYQGLKFTLGAAIAGDFTLTRILLSKYDEDTYEANPFMLWWVDNDFKAALMGGAVIAFVFWSADELWKTNRTAGFIVMTIGILIKGYVIYHNLQLLRGG